MSCVRFGLLGWVIRLFIDSRELIATFSHTSCGGCKLCWPEPCPSNIL
jgi:hypothetical protein